MDVCDSCGNIRGTSACKYCDNDYDSYTEETMEFKNSAVDHPNHYTSGKIECIDAIRAALTDEEFRGYCKGNILKYTWREKIKNGDEDILKAATYLRFIQEK